LRVQAIVFAPALPISRTLRAWATITSCPHSLNNWLAQGECIPVSNAMGLRGIPLKTSVIAQFQNIGIERRQLEKKHY
jgi:hypothetical protein